MENPKRYSEKVKRKEGDKSSGLRIPSGSYNMMQELSIIQPLFEPHYKSIFDQDDSDEVEVHAKLEISQAQDQSEMQADEMADAFMRGDADHSQQVLSQTAPEISRQGEGGGMETSNEFDQQLQGTKGQGQKLEEGVKSELEEHTGTDLSRVNIHTDASAHAMSESINAKAFAHGQDIYFKQGNYDVQSEQGKELLAHEVAHTVQQGDGVLAKIQKQDDDDTRRYYDIVIPPGSTSKEGFRHYAEMIIFGRVVDLDWAEPTGNLAVIYDDIANHVGETVRFGVDVSNLEKYKIDVDNTANTNASGSFNALKGNDKNEIVDEINKRYYDKTGITPGTVIQAGDVNNASVWNQIRDEVMREKEIIENLPPDIKKFIHIENGVKPEDFEKYATVAELLSQFNSADFLDYLDKVNFETTDLEMLQHSLEDYLKEKETRKVESDNFETVKTKLYGLETLYKRYKDFLADQQITDSIQYLTQEQANLDRLSKENGFKDLEDFKTCISDYEKGFEAFTVRLAEDHLYRYQHQLYEEEKRLNDPVHISNLFKSLQDSKAQEHFEEASSLRNQADAYIGDFGKLSGPERAQKTELQQKASSEESQGEMAVKALDSLLTKEDQFDAKAFARQSSEEKMKSFLLEYLQGKKSSVDETWEDIHNHPDHVYELNTLLAASISAQNIQEGSIYDLIIKDKTEEINKYKILKAVCFVIIGLVLTIATFGAAAPVAIAAGVVSAGISLYGVYEAVDEYKRNNAANDVGLLTDDPSLIWVMLAIAGAAVDLAALSTAFKLAKPVAAMTKEFNLSMDAPKLEKNLATLAELDVRLQANIVKQARIQAYEDKLLKELAASRGMLMVTIPGLSQTGELVARAIFAIRKGIVSLDSFIAELKAAKIIEDMGLNADELLLVKDAFTKGRMLAGDEKVVADVEKAIANSDFVSLKNVLNQAEIEKLWPASIPKSPVSDLSLIKNGCEDVAQKIQKAIGGEFLEVTNPINFRGNPLQLGPVKGQSIGWYNHVAVIKNGIVFDRMTGIEGMELFKYKTLFDYSPDLSFDIVEKSKFIK